MPFTTNLCQTAGQNQLAGTGQMQAQVASARELLEEAAKGPALRRARWCASLRPRTPDRGY
jgi:hypothetical protein